MLRPIPAHLTQDRLIYRSSAIRMPVVGNSADSDEDQELIQFVVDHLDTIPHLEALLLIWQNQDTRWTADLLAGRIYVSHPVARNVLSDLYRRGALSSEGGFDPIYLFRGSWDSERQMLPRLAELYRRQLVQITKLIHSRSSLSAREFARAFQIKNDPPKDYEHGSRRIHAWRDRDSRVQYITAARVCDKTTHAPPLVERTLLRPADDL